MTTEPPVRTPSFVGSFLEPAPWVVDPPTMPWRTGIDGLRRAAREQAPALLTPPRLPPARFAHVVATVGVTALPALVMKRRGRGSPAEQRSVLARHLRAGFEHLGVTFIKLGQIISSTEGMLPDELVVTFASCRDQAPPESFDHVRTIVEADLGRPLEETFARFDRLPIAAASIAQVHAATLHTGEEVVVKVQRPDLRRTVTADLAAMTWLVRILERRMPDLRLLNLGAYVELFAETIVEELDFRLEAQNMLDIAEVLAESAGRRVVVPRPHPELVTEHVLVMERLHGHKVNEAADLLTIGADAAQVLEALLVSFFEGSLIHGVFHGDMHGGNMLVTHDGTPALLDLGMTGRFAPEARPHLVQLLLSPNEAIRMKLDAFKALGGFPPDTDMDHIQALLADAEKKKTAADDAKAAGQEAPHDLAADTKQLLTTLVGLGARIPKELFLFVKGVLYLNGALAALGADIDLASAFGGVALHFATHHADQLAAEAGVDPERMRADAANTRQQMTEDLGLDADVERITFADMKAARAAKTRDSPRP
jgi:ubiquinone biosynthesis protein